MRGDDHDTVARAHDCGHDLGRPGGWNAVGLCSGGAGFGRALPALTRSTQRGRCPALPAHLTGAWGGAWHLQDRPFRDPLPVLPDVGARLAAVWEKKIRQPRQKRLPQALSDAQVRRLLGAVSNPVHRACFTLIYACGLRISEAATLEVTAIDTAHGVLRVIGKGDKERRVPLPEPVLNDLRRTWRHHHHRRWLFPNRAGPAPLSTGVLLRGRRSDGRAGRSPPANPPYPAPQLCHPAAGERRRYPHRPGSALF